MQGLTEFIPVSSSAHLVLIPYTTGWPDQGRTIDIAAHLGSLGAVILYFRKDVAAVLSGAHNLLFSKTHRGSNLFLLLVIGSAPAIVGGAFLILVDETWLRSLKVIAWATIIGAFALLAADKYGRNNQSIENMTYNHAIIIGMLQILALIPGASRAGTAITGALFCGYKRSDAARFSMLLSIPVILAASCYNTFDIVAKGEGTLTFAAGITALLAFTASYGAISFMMKWLDRASYTPFIFYRFLLGGMLFWWAYLSGT